MENGRVNDYTSADLMAAILSVQEAMGMYAVRTDARFDAVDARFDRFEQSMNRRFDRVDERFDGLESRVTALERHGSSPPS